MGFFSSLRLPCAVFALAASLWGCMDHHDVDPSDPDHGDTKSTEIPSGERGKRVSCTRNVGLYSWDQRNWRDPPSSELLRFLASGEVCGDVYVNVADYSNARSLKDERALLQFLREVRRTNAAGVVYLTYGDVTEKDERAVEDFVETFFRWTRQLSPSEVQAIVPIGVSFDIEHFPARTFQRVLSKAQQAKAQLLQQAEAGSSYAWQPEDLLIQCTIEGAYKPVDTDIIMRLADRALMMVYRNSLARLDAGRAEEAEGEGNNDLVTRLRWFLREQCEKCLDDEYAKANYRAKISIMVETACRVGNSCKQISFCAKTRPGAGASEGAENVFKTLTEFEKEMESSGLVTEEQKKRLFVQGGESKFVVHHFEWFQCYFGRSRAGLCENFDLWAETCRSQ